MTMHIFFNKDHDGYKKDWSGYVERALARRFCTEDIAIPYQKHLDNIYDAKQARKADLLKKKESTKIKKADSKKVKKRSKAVKL